MPCSTTTYPLGHYPALGWFPVQNWSVVVTLFQIPDLLNEIEDLKKQVSEQKVRCEATEKNENNKRQTEEKRHLEEIQFLKFTNQELKVRNKKITLRRSWVLTQKSWLWFDVSSRHNWNWSSHNRSDRYTSHLYLFELKTWKNKEKSRCYFCSVNEIILEWTLIINWNSENGILLWPAVMASLH